MNNNIDLKPTEKMEYIHFWCQKVIPLVFDDSLSYYEAICKFMQKLNEVINALNNNAECIDELQGKYIILQNNFDALEVKWEEFKTYIENEFNTFKTEITTREENFETTINNEFTSFKNYVENYLNNIDVQSYVNIKIDELAESGYFSTLLESLGFNPDNYLAKNNTTVYVPTNDYNPATKKYVDEHSSGGAVYNAGDGIKIIDGTISTTNYNAGNNDKNGITITGCTIIGKDNNIHSNDRNSIFGNNNTIGENITNSIIVGDQNDITGTSSFHNSNIIIGRQNRANKTHQTITLGNNNDVNLLNQENITLIGHNCGTIKEVNENTEGSIIISNGTTGNEHNAIIITRTQNDGTLGNIHTFNQIMGHRGYKDWTELERDEIYPLPYEINMKVDNDIGMIRNDIDNLSQEISGIASNTAIDYTLTFNNDIVTNIIRNSNYKYLFNGYKYTNTAGEPVENVVYGYFNIVLEYSFTDDLNVAKLFTRAIGGAEELNSIIGIWKENENSTTECYPCVINCRENSSTHDIEYMLVTNINGQIRKSGRIEIKGIL